MNWLDAVIIVLVLWFTFAAFQAGFIRESVTVVAAVIGVALAGLFYKDLADDVLLFIDNGQLANIVAFVIIFSAAALAGQMMALVLKPTVNVLQLGIFDQLLGAGFGIAKAIVFIQVFVILFVTYPRWGLENDIDHSLFGSLVIEKTAVLVHLLPAEFEGGVDDFNRGTEI
ncbi:MAG: CvpA family protein [Dehalococcoidia bacterium]